ncbi:hypothetical protein BDN67DRAFT_1009231 [Paxillus ammoniavirescens]|nr:hypothetical protein BDN67DRAFT_1009231 [Paxillus ammoniavirescens]
MLNISPLFLEKIKVFASLVEGFTEIHPYVKAAWFILSEAVQVVAARKLLNQTVKMLVEAMDDAYSFVSEANALKSIESNRKTPCPNIPRNVPVLLRKSLTATA